MEVIKQYWYVFAMVVFLVINEILLIEGKEMHDEIFDKAKICLQPPFIGQCRAKLTRYYYYPRRKQCEIFYFGGCGGNKNNFNTKEQCEQTCMEVELSRPAINHTDEQKITRMHA